MRDPLKRKKGLYIVSERACLSPYSGAGKHIEVGIKELSKKFDIQLLLFCKPLLAAEYESSRSTQQKSGGIFTAFKKAAAWVLKWWIILARNHLHFIQFYRLVKKERADFIYERAAYLNFNGLLISALLRIPHYYEVNGLYYKDNSVYFPKVYTRIARHLEYSAYKKRKCFFVGGLNIELGLNEGPASVIIQNGIEESFLDYFPATTYQETDGDSGLNLIFVGHAMRHHRLDILTGALKMMKSRVRVCLHLVGSNYEGYEQFFVDMEEIKIVRHGVLTHEQLVPLLKKMDAGIVPFALGYYSNMKIFLYTAARLILVLPESRNFKRIFTSEEAVFFKNESVVALAGVLEDIVVNRNRYHQIREAAFEKIKENYTWPAIFRTIITKIDQA